MKRFLLSLLPRQWRVFLVIDLPDWSFKVSPRYRRQRKTIERLCNYKKEWTFEEFHEAWKRDFHDVLKFFNVGFSNRAIKDLFYWWHMSNWKAMHLETSEYKDCTKEELIDRFVGEVYYCSDRMSYDRLFRCHWLFRQAFYKEMLDYQINKL